MKIWEGEKGKVRDPSKSRRLNIRSRGMLDMLTGPVAGFILISRPIIYSQEKKKAHVKGQNRFAQICPSMLPPVPSLPPQPCPLLCSVVPRRLRDALGLAWLEGRESAGMRTRKRTRWTGSETPLPPPPLGFHSRVPCRISLEKCLQS